MITTIVISIVALVVALAALALVIDTRARSVTAIDFIKSQPRLERSTEKASAVQHTVGQRGFAKATHARKQPASSPIRAEDTPPQSIAPKLKNPPLASGFGSNASQISAKSGESKEGS